jgi:acetyl-CoA carboxylase biotin carboxyl carrier protein
MHEAALRRLKELIAFAREHRLAELAVEEPDFKVRFRTSLGVSTAPPVGPVPAPPSLPRSPVPVATRPESALIRSPLFGVFYRAPAPGERCFVEVGDHIEVGQVIGLIEAMKVFNEIAAEVSGVVAEICAQEASLVQQGDVLMALDHPGDA